MTGILSSHPILQRAGVADSRRIIASGVLPAVADPLAHIPFLLRLQTHRGEWADGLAGVWVRGSGTSELNGFYNVNGEANGKPLFTMQGSPGCTIYWEPAFGEGPCWLMYASEGSLFGYKNFSGDLPPASDWTALGGALQPPTIEVVNRIKKPVGLYQDIGCTVPAVASGDPVAAWRDEVSGIGLVATQSVFTKQPTLQFENGIPVVAFDGVDDFLSVVLPRPFPFSLAIGAKSSNTNFGGMAGYGASNIAIGHGFLGAPPSDAFWLWTPSVASSFGQSGNLDTNWHTHIGTIPSADESAWSMYLDGTNTGSPGLTEGVPLADSTILYIGQSGANEPWAGRMTSYVQSDDIWDNGNVARISSYIDGLNASNISDVPFDIRLQTHRNEWVDGVAGVWVRGAGQPELDGFYEVLGTDGGKPNFRKPDRSGGDYVLFWNSGWGPPCWQINKDGDYYGYSSNEDSPLPPATGWTSNGGANPPPTIEVVAGVKKPIGLYQDTACTIPATTAGQSIAAWRDEISGSGLVATQSVSTKRPVLWFVEGTPVVRFDGIDDSLELTIESPGAPFSYLASGRFRSPGLYPALIGAPNGGVTFGGHNGHASVGINVLGTNDPQEFVNVDNEWFAFSVTADTAGLRSYHVIAPEATNPVNALVQTDHVDTNFYQSSGNLLIGNGHGGTVPAALDATAVMIFTGGRWSPAAMETISRHSYRLNP